MADWIGSGPERSDSREPRKCVGKMTATTGKAVADHRHHRPVAAAQPRPKPMAATTAYETIEA